MKTNNLIGQKFGRLLVIKKMDNNKWGSCRWLCVCDCGKEKIIRDSHLKSGHTKSCGCLHKEKLIKRLTKHGHNTRIKISKTYNSWLSMIQRCTNPKNKNYKHYGDRGIKVCNRWLKFENFLTDMGEHPGKGYSIDRINNNGNYCKSNCRWATEKEQHRNKRDNHLETYKGKTQCLREWSEEFGINYYVLWSRLNRGWSIEKALITPVRKYRKG